MSLSSGSSSSGHSAGGGPYIQPPRYYYERGDDEFSGRNLVHQSNPQNHRKTGSVSVQNGAVNLHIPCAFSYAYDVPVPPQNSYKDASRPTSHQSRSGIKISNSNNPSRHHKDAQIPKESRPFYSTVKSGQLYKAKNVPHHHSTSKSQNRTSIVWDLHAGNKVPYQAVDYGKELYEQAAQNMARTLEQEKLSQKPSKSGDEVENNCFDFSKPGINFSRKTTRDLEKATDNLKHLPLEVDQLLRKDKRFEPILLAKATKSLNISRNSRIYKDLIPIDPNPDVRTEAENNIQAEIKRSIEAQRQPNRTKDVQPNLLEFQSNSYTKVRPQPVPTPAKPSDTLINADIAHDFDTIEDERLHLKESNDLNS